MLNSLELGIFISRWDNENVHVTGLWGMEVLEPAQIYLSARGKMISSLPLSCAQVLTKADTPSSVAAMHSSPWCKANLEYIIFAIITFRCTCWKEIKLL